jgi:phospholipid/cholesterol/gamma-HCH transport system ATP-binding protein
MHADKGEIYFDGQGFHTMSKEQRKDLRNNIGMLFQGNALFDSKTVQENVRFPLDMFTQLSLDEKNEKVSQTLARVNLEGVNDKYPAEISGGMKKRAALARAIICRPALMLYDEPTTGLDPIVADSINRLILHLGKMLGMASIVVTHDMTSARMVGDRIAYLHEGKIYFQGTPDQVDKCEDPLVRDFVRGHAQGIDVVG